MNTIKVTTELCQEDRQRIDELITFAGLIVGELKSRPQIRAEEHPIDAPTTHLETPAEPTPDPEPVIETPEPVAEPEPDVKPVSLAEFQKAVTLAVSKGAEAKTAVKAVINKYAPSVSGVPEDKRAEVMAELSKI